MYWGFTTQWTQRGHVERCQLTWPHFYLAGLVFRRFTSIVHILSPEIDNCPSWINGRERMNVENISWSSSLKNVAHPAGVESATSRLQVGRSSNLTTEAGIALCWRVKVVYLVIIIDPWYWCWLSRGVWQIDIIFSNKKNQENKTSYCYLLPQFPAQNKQHLCCRRNKHHCFKIKLIKWATLQHANNWEKSTMDLHIFF